MNNWATGENVVVSIDFDRKVSCLRDFYDLLHAPYLAFLFIDLSAITQEKNENQPNFCAAKALKSNLSTLQLYHRCRNKSLNVDQHV